MVDRRQLRDAPERRAVAATEFEFRSLGDSIKLTGYASVFNHPYSVLGGPPMGWTERVDPGAFNVTLASKPDLHLLINHEGMPLARTKSGTLQLSTDSTGLLVEAELDRRDPDVQRLQTKMERGDMDEMSFGFRTKRDEWTDGPDGEERRLLEVSLHKGDVSVVNFGANPATSAQLNSFDQALEFIAGLDQEEALAEIRSLDDSPQRLAEVREKLAAIHARMLPRRGGPLSLAQAKRVLAGELDLGAAAVIRPRGEAK